ncbi:hypothetical protein QTP70_029836 [Hemibagrus guttatus]|uniref:Reverse transcriptase domain-containing protein n=1 Tax=Hemibagrus guttatus TaxID=175788 RepID=A0AAE0UYS5_9TELE|nr:hypothetical protein QTP70_029836 [Hemibagrus guttatus]
MEVCWTRQHSHAKAVYIWTPYHPNCSMDDAITTTLHLALTHLDNQDTYLRMLYIDFSSAFNTIILQHLIEKLSLLGSLCNWILDFLTRRLQSVQIENSISSTTTLSTGAPQGCVISPLRFTLLTHDCAAMHSSNHIIKFTDDMTVVCLISKNDESAYRGEVQQLTAWCRANDLSLNVDKTKKMETLREHRVAILCSTSTDPLWRLSRAPNSFAFIWWRTSPGHSTPAPSSRKPSGISISYGV